ncbi:hypothetical protein [Paenibacillus tepidiphilus]|uniref:hypothetical protein n=1 Tax=Paenibacillus tepidiphilus TaxID=2608683 RepID=UPI00123932B6|nr:hypothetical protein [Paenibacillus tepidiphilus]
MGKIIPFPINQRSQALNNFPISESDRFKRYLQESDNWQHQHKAKTMYPGYPEVPPCDPPRSDMQWFVHPHLKFGVWVINSSEFEVIANPNLAWGWSAFVLKSAAPVYEPMNLNSVEIRKNITWIVDYDGFGQYGLVSNKGDIWIPHERPSEWGASRLRQ